MSKKYVALGIDIGGTKIRAGLVDRGGNLFSQPREIQTMAHSSAEKILFNLEALLNSLLSENENFDLAGVGVGCTGPLDTHNGIILNVANLPTLNYFHLKEWLQNRISNNIVLNNDANALLLGEALFGGGKGCSSVLGLTLGTGLGCALIINNHIWEGNTGNAGEIWSSPYKEGCIEDYVSGTALSKRYSERAGVFLSARRVANLAYDGDIQAKQVWGDFAQDLAYTIAWTSNLFDPEVIVLGGSVTKSSGLFLSETKNALCSKFGFSDRAANIKVASLGEDAGVIGASALIFNQ
jgi:Transcriptional regulator/sugar kinase